MWCTRTAEILLLLLLVVVRVHCNSSGGNPPSTPPSIGSGHYIHTFLLPVSTAALLSGDRTDRAVRLGCRSAIADLPEKSAVRVFLGGEEKGESVNIEQLWSVFFTFSSLFDFYPVVRF